MSIKVPPSPPPLNFRPLVDWSDNDLIFNDYLESKKGESKDELSPMMDALGSQSADNGSVKSNKSGSINYVYPVGSAFQVARNRQ